MERTVELSTVWNRLLAYRRPITIFVAVATILTGIAVFMLPPWYQATGSLLPPGEDDSSFGIARLLKGVAVPGIKIPTQATPADVFLAVLDSRRIREEIVNRFGLKKAYKKKYMQDAIKELKSHVKFKLTDAGTIDMQYEDTQPVRAQHVLEAYVELLDRFNREVRTTKGRRTRTFVETRLNETKLELARSEQKLADYQVKHKAAIITPEMSTAVETAARIYAQRTSLQVRLGVVRNYTREGSQEQQQIENQIAELDKQMANLPETGLELARLLRDTKKYEQIYILLTAQYEEARIDEARDVVTVDVLDAPAVPERKDRPHRLLIIAIGFVFSLGVGVAYALFQEDEGPRSQASAAR